MADWVNDYHGLSWTNFHNAAVRLRSDEAVNSPKVFNFGTTDVGDPCNPQSKGPALVVYYKDVINQDFEVQPFNVYLELTDTKLPNPQWSKYAGPDSGDLSDAGSTTATFSNPSKGGLYQFDLTLAGQTTRTQLLLPLGGPDVSDYFLSEAQRYDQWLNELKTRVYASTSDQFARGAIILAYFTKTVANMNHKNQTIELDGSPCKNETDGTVTICDHVFGKDHIGNFLFSYLAARTQITFGTTKFGADLVARLTTKARDNPDDQAAYTAGYAYGQAPNDNFCDILETKNIAAMQITAAKRGWPSETLWPQDKWVQYPTWGATHGGLTNPD